ncbi:unnamed protein product [Bursaphelenchus xylophilus]|uniref:(pine wood nematode) hypothetical protein n=1 Tax=Bursaphelenchus xylophilus TaxID=6326 RepID=A0A1I7SQQ7_BURXY|nr:unnamed protein product [Bursaphelenchus xylophilus]CAG9110245.1 unnamed protein product [Bursaphelenchus xylophilus]
MSTRRREVRDTARDIIQGTQPSGRGPRRPREGYATLPLSRRNSANGANRDIADLQNQVDQLRRQQSDLLGAQDITRRQNEAANNRIQRQAGYLAGGGSNRDMDEIRRALSAIENRMLLFGQELSSIKGTVDRHTNDLIAVNNEVKARPLADQARLQSNTQQLDSRIRDLHNQMMALRRSVDTEVSDRVRVNQTQQDTINRLQETIRQQEANRNELLANVTRRGDLDKAKLDEETRRLNDRIQLITTEVSRNLNDREQRLRDDLLQKYNGVQMSVKSQFDARLERENEIQRNLDERLRNQDQLIEQARAQIQQQKTKNKERFQKVNSALATLQKYFDAGNKKIDKLMNSEIQARRVHERGLLGRVTNTEDKVNAYLNSLSAAVDEVRAGNENAKMPNIDIEALRREIEGIAADKNKLSMEGLLKLEEKISRMQHSLNRDRREIQGKLSDSNDARQNKLKSQMAKLDDLLDDVERTQDRVRDKVERQIPRDLNELSAKVDNLKQQMTRRIDHEEEERYQAIKELQDAYGKLVVRNRADRRDGSAAPSSSALKRDIDECKVAIQKLAESVTTVKNVLDRRLMEEIRKRETDVETLTARADALAAQVAQRAA